MMGSALAFPARENGNTVRLVGTPLDREIIDECRKTNRHPKFAKHFPKGIPPFPEGCEFYQIEEMERRSKVRISSSAVCRASASIGSARKFCRSCLKVYRFSR